MYIQKNITQKKQYFVNKEIDMIENNKLLEMTLSEILSLNQDYKMKVIQLLINQIAEDEVYNAVSHFETKKEQEEYIKYIKG